jgi:hypothetical protein
MKKLEIITILLTAFLFFNGISSTGSIKKTYPLSGLLPSERYLWTATNAGLLPSDANMAILVNQRDLLFWTPPPLEEDDEGGGTDVGSAPVHDHLLVMIICTIVYAFYNRKKMSQL